MKMITAIIRKASAEKIIQSLKNMGISGMTFGEITGIGDQVPASKPYVIHTRIEIIIPDEQVNEVSNLILEHAHTGLPGDGLIAVFPVTNMIKIRTRESVE